MPLSNALKTAMVLTINPRHYQQTAHPTRVLDSLVQKYRCSDESSVTFFLMESG
jgi:hypothetical protein